MVHRATTSGVSTALRLPESPLRFAHHDKMLDINVEPRLTTQSTQAEQKILESCPVYYPSAIPQYEEAIVHDDTEVIAPTSRLKEYAFEVPDR